MNIVDEPHQSPSNQSSSHAPVRAHTYAEHLTPGWLWWLIAVVSGLLVGLAAMPLGWIVGLVIGGMATAGACVALGVSSPRISVAPAGPGDQGDRGEEGPTLHVGPAAIALHHLGHVEVLDEAAYRRAIGPDADLRDWTMHRPWVTSGVRVAVIDERDPAPAWVIASRRPAALAKAITAAPTGS